MSEIMALKHVIHLKASDLGRSHIFGILGTATMGQSTGKCAGARF